MKDRICENDSFDRAEGWGWEDHSGHQPCGCQRISVAIFDMDQQESAAIWADRRKSDMPHVEFLTERRLAEGLKAAERGAFDLAIIDTPPEDSGPNGRTGSRPHSHPVPAQLG